MFYPKNMTEQLEHSLFRMPACEYRGTPFWSWNCKLEKDMILSQIETFKLMGFGGFHIHARTGLDTPYLGDEFMEFVKLSNKKAIEEGMLCWLYDEDRFPSGYAGGIVTADLRFRARHLLFSQSIYEGFDKTREAFDLRTQKGEKSKGYYLASYYIKLNGANYLEKYERIDQNDKNNPEYADGDVWHAYVRLSEEQSWYNGKTYVDVLNRAATEKFIEVTHEKYYKKVGEEFGKSIPAIFTDEPQLSRKSTLKFARQKGDVTFSYTDDLPEDYYGIYGEDLLDYLPELFWELPENEISLMRYRYHNLITERFVSSFSDTLGEWCEKHNIALTGHLMSERTLFSQTIALGEAMRHFRRFHLPGADILCDAKEYSTIKQAVSVARQYGREGVLSELYGVTHWNHDFKGHKLQGDWQAALGVTVRVPHLTFMSMEGEAKRDWPASIGYQSPWYIEYSYIEDHFARLNTALTRGYPIVSVGVIHPIESYWLSWGPNDQTGVFRDEYDQNYANLIQWMLHGFIDFDFISEALLPEICEYGGKNPIEVGKMRYNAVVIPFCSTLRKTTVERLEAFKDAGGKIIFVGNIPTHMDALPSDRVKRLAQNCGVINSSKTELLTALESERILEVRLSNGKLADNLLCQIRQDNERRWVFLCHVNRKKSRLDEPATYIIRINGKYNPSLYDTMTGEIKSCPGVIEDNHTVITRKMFSEDSLLLCLEEGIPVTPKKEGKTNPANIIKVSDPLEFALSEPNVVLLDRAEYAFDTAEFHPSEEILKIDSIFRQKLDYPARNGDMAQPWCIQDDRKAEHALFLRFKINSEIEVCGAKFAMENPENAVIIINGKELNISPDGFFTDKSIKTLPIPVLPAGLNEITVRIPFYRKTNVEWCYLLGDFGVRTSGSHISIIKLCDRLTLGDWTVQGLPFYAGNVTYRCCFETDKYFENAILEIPHFSAPVISVALNGKKRGLIAFAPHMLSLGALSLGKHILEITVYGNRYNAFGTLHNSDDEFIWYGPHSYRTEKSQWTDSYMIKQMGILDKILIKCYDSEQYNLFT